MLGLAEKDTKNIYYSCISYVQKAKQRNERNKKTQIVLLKKMTMFE